MEAIQWTKELVSEDADAQCRTLAGHVIASFHSKLKEVCCCLFVSVFNFFCLFFSVVNIWQHWRTITTIDFVIIFMCKLMLWLSLLWLQ